MEGMKAYFEDLSAEVRKGPSMLVVAVAMLLVGLGTSSELMARVCDAVTNGLEMSHSGGQVRFARTEIRLLVSGDDSAEDDSERQ